MIQKTRKKKGGKYYTINKKTRKILKGGTVSIEPLLWRNNYESIVDYLSKPVFNYLIIIGNLFGPPLGLPGKDSKQDDVTKREMIVTAKNNLEDDILSKINGLDLRSREIICKWVRISHKPMPQYKTAECLQNFYIEKVKLDIEKNYPTLDWILNKSLNKGKFGIMKYLEGGKTEADVFSIFDNTSISTIQLLYELK